MAAQDATNSSQQVNTGTSGGSAGNNTIAGGAGPIASPTAVVAPKGYRLELQQMLQGWQELIPGDTTFPSSAGSLTLAAVLAKLQGYLGAYTDLDTHVMGARQARAQMASQELEVRAYQAVLKAAMISYFGAGSPQLVKFGLKAAKARTPLTSTQLAVRAAKVMATRKLRGTMGSVQKAGIKSGPMQLTVGPTELTVGPVPSAGQSTAPAATGTVTSTAPPEAVSTTSPVAGK